MPELPDVEVYRSYVQQHAVGRTVKKVVVNDKKCVEGTPQALASTEGHKIKSAKRIGKNLLIEMTKGPWITMHFGMTGKPKYYEQSGKEPKHARVIFELENSHALAFVCPRKFGKVGTTENAETLRKEKYLGPDVLDLKHFEDFEQLLQGKTGMIKTTLMDQRLLAGIGNVYADEILFQARVHPETKVNKLKQKDLRQIFEIMQEVMETAINSEAKWKQMPKNFLITHRHDKDDCPYCDGKVKKLTVGGRSTYICPSCQKKMS